MAGSRDRNSKEKEEKSDDSKADSKLKPTISANEFKRRAEVLMSRCKDLCELKKMYDAYRYKRMGEEHISLARFGYHFAPNDKEIIQFLLKLTKKEPLPSRARKYMVHKDDIYGQKAPWEIFCDVKDPWTRFDEDGCRLQDHDEEYVTKLIYAYTKTEDSNRDISRNAGWFPNSERQTITVSGDVTGYKRELTYRVPGGQEISDSKYGHWSMREYTLAGPSDLVFCKVTKDVSMLQKPETCDKRKSMCAAETSDSSCKKIKGSLDLNKDSEFDSEHPVSNTTDHAGY